MENVAQNKFQFSEKKCVEGYIVCGRGDELPKEEIFETQPNVIEFKFLVFGPVWVCRCE